MADINLKGMGVALITPFKEDESVDYEALGKLVDYQVLQKITDRILKEVEHVNRVCFDLSPKPPATIEFE